MRHWTEYKSQEYEYIPAKKNIECTAIFTFDIETTSFFVDEKKGAAFAYDPTYTDDEYSTFEKGACCYIWQFGAGEVVYYGRELKEFPSFLEKISIDIVPCALKYIWVHNLAFEFQFLRGYLFFDSVFARKEREPIKAESSGWTFRCSYMLTRLSLAAWGKKIGIDKLDGVEFNYQKIRTPLTPLSDYEQAYAERDCIVVYRGILQFVKKYGSQSNIPLTQTGEVRADLKKLYKNDAVYHKRITALLPETEDDYKLLRLAFHGGSCGSYNIHAGYKQLEVGSFDEASAYPYIMATHKFPCQKFREIEKTDSNTWDFEKYAYIFCIKMSKVKARSYLTYWSKSYCVSTHNALVANGKIVNADEMLIVCTEQDFETLRKVYRFNYEIIKLYRARKAYLDKKMIRYIQHLFENKTKLDGVQGMEDIYLQSKQFINSLYGCCVMNLVQDIVEYTNGICESSGFEKTIPAYGDIKKEKNEKWYNNIFAYSTGVWVTAYARNRLYKALLRMGNDLVYWDTDSCKALNMENHVEYFDKENRKADKLLQKACDYAGLPKDAFTCKKPSGKVKTLGHWEREETCQEFKTLGAKKYCYRKNGKVGITVAGVPKRYGDTLKFVDDFREDSVFNRDAEINGKKIAKNASFYLDGNNPHVTLNRGLPDEWKVQDDYGLCLKPVPYVLSMSDYRVALMSLKGWRI